MEIVFKNLIKNNCWSKEYLKLVFNEFEKFISIKNFNNKAIPCNDIDIFWKEFGKKR